MADWEFSLLFVLFKKQHFCVNSFLRCPFFLKFVFIKLSCALKKTFIIGVKGMLFKGTTFLSLSFYFLGLINCYSIKNNYNNCRNTKPITIYHLICKFYLQIKVITFFRNCILFTLHEHCPNTELFLVHIFLYSD